MEIYKLELRKLSLEEVGVLVILGIFSLLVYILKLVIEALEAREDYNELWAKQVTGTGQWFCFVEWNTFIAFITFLCLVSPLVSADTCGLISVRFYQFRDSSLVCVAPGLSGYLPALLLLLALHGSVGMGESWYFHWGTGFPYVIFACDKAE